MDKQKQLLYISHPYGNKEQNKNDIENIIRYLYHSDEIFDNYCLVSPVHCFGFLYEDWEYEKGIQPCLDLLGECDGMLVFDGEGAEDWTTSTGCKMEVAKYEEWGMPYRFMGSFEKIKSEGYAKIHSEIKEMLE